MFQVTLKTARESCGITIKQAANHCSLSDIEYEQIEQNTELATVGMLKKLKSLYNDIPLDLIHIGYEADCTEHNRQK